MSTLLELLPKDLKKSIGGLILQRWANLHTAMHGAGFCLHPEYHGGKYEQEKNSEAMTDLLTMCEKFHGKGSDKASKAMRQWTDLYKGRNGVFENEMVFNLAKDADPVLWWKTWVQPLALSSQPLPVPCAAFKFWPNLALLQVRSECGLPTGACIPTPGTGCRRVGPRRWRKCILTAER